MKTQPVTCLLTLIDNPEEAELKSGFKIHIFSLCSLGHLSRLGSWSWVAGVGVVRWLGMLTRCLPLTDLCIAQFGSTLGSQSTRVGFLSSFPTGWDKPGTGLLLGVDVSVPFFTYWLMISVNIK